MGLEWPAAWPGQIAERDSPINTFRLFCTYGKTRCVYVCPVFHTCVVIDFHLMRPTYISSQVSSATFLQRAEPSLSSVFCPLPRRPGTPVKIPPLACFLLKMSVPPTPFSPYKKTARVWLLGAWPPPPQCLCMNAEKN